MRRRSSRLATLDVGTPIAARARSSSRSAKRGLGPRVLEYASVSERNLDHITEPSIVSNPSKPVDLVVSINDVPLFLRYNRFVLHGYRASPLTAWEAVYSVFGYFHNESLNIATHGAGAILTLCWALNWLLSGSGYEVVGTEGALASAPHALAWVIVLADICSAFCFAMSARYHTMMAAAPDEGTYKALLADDLAGVVLINAVRCTQRAHKYRIRGRHIYERTVRRIPHTERRILPMFEPRCRAPPCACAGCCFPATAWAQFWQSPWVPR